MMEIDPQDLWPLTLTETGTKFHIVTGTEDWTFRDIGNANIAWIETRAISALCGWKRDSSDYVPRITNLENVKNANPWWGDRLCRRCMKAAEKATG